MINEKDYTTGKESKQMMWIIILLVVCGLGTALYGIKHHIRCDTEYDPGSANRTICHKTTGDQK